MQLFSINTNQYLSLSTPNTHTFSSPSKILYFLHKIFLTLNFHFYSPYMAFSIEAGVPWSTMEDVLLCEAWVHISHCPITGNEMKFSHMWKKIHAEFFERSGSARTEMALASRWKLLNKELGKWRDALAKAMDNHRSGQNLSDEVNSL